MLAAVSGRSRLGFLLFSQSRRKHTYIYIRNSALRCFSFAAALQRDLRKAVSCNHSCGRGRDSQWHNATMAFISPRTCFPKSGGVFRESTTENCKVPRSFSNRLGTCARLLRPQNWNSVSFVVRSALIVSNFHCGMCVYRMSYVQWTTIQNNAPLSLPQDSGKLAEKTSHRSRHPGGLDKSKTCCPNRSTHW